MLHFPRVRFANPLFFDNFFIIFCICLCCFSNRFTSCIWVPEPFAMRFFLELFTAAGNLRSEIVIELIIASSLVNSLLST